MKKCKHCGQWDEVNFLRDYYPRKQLARIYVSPGRVEKAIEVIKDVDEYEFNGYFPEGLVTDDWNSGLIYNGKFHIPDAAKVGKRFDELGIDHIVVIDESSYGGSISDEGRNEVTYKFPTA